MADLRFNEMRYLRWLLPHAFDDLRLRTFRDEWPHQSPTPEAMALAGFSFFGPSGTDRSRCFYCDIILQDFEPHDDPLEEHRRLSPFCPVFGERRNVDRWHDLRRRGWNLGMQRRDVLSRESRN